jgi:hypothetical protein
VQKGEYYFNDYNKAISVLNKFLVPLSEIQNKTLYFTRLAPVLNLPVEELYFKITSDSFLSAYDSEFKDGYDSLNYKKYNDYVLTFKGCDGECDVYVWFDRDGNIYMTEDEMFEDLDEHPDLPRFGVYGSYDDVKKYVKSIMPSSATLVTSYSDLDDKWFYNLMDENDHFGTRGVYIKDYEYKVYLSDDLTTSPSEEEDSGDITLRSDGRFDFDGDAVFVYKMPLKGYSFTPIQLQYIMEEEFFDVYESLGISKLTFNNGYIYCSLIWNHCWIDQDAMEDVITQFGN